MPGRASKQIRKVERTSLGDFDDQIWPVNVAIVILGGIVAGVVFATSSFDDPRILYNGWVRLGSVGAAMAVLFWAVFWLQGKMLRRVQLCVVISLLIHVGLALFLHEKYLDLLADLEKSGGQYPSPQREPITVPDYAWDQIERPDAPQSFEEPVEVETPDLQTHELPKPLPVEQPLRPEDLPIEPKLPEQQQPTPAELRRTEILTAPRRAESLSGTTISRQEIHHRPEPAESQAQPELKVSQPPLSGTPQSRTAEARRRAEAPAQPDLSQQAPVELPAPAAPQKPQRAVQAESLPENNTQRSVAARSTPAAELPQSQLDMPPAASVAQSPPAIQRQPQAAATERRTQSLAQTLQPSGAQAAAPQAVVEAAASPARRQQPAEAPSQTYALDRRQPAAATLPRPTEALPDMRSLAAQAENPSRPEARSAQSQRPSPASMAAQVMRPLPDTQEPAGMNGAAQLSRTAARRVESPGQGPTAESVAASQRGSLARAETGIALPSSAAAMDNAALPAASGAAPPSSIARVSSSAAVERSATAAPNLQAIAAAGSAEYAVGAAPVQARMGQPRTTAGEGPSLPANATESRIARSETGAAVPSLPGLQGTSMPSAPAAATGGEPSQVADAQAAGVSRDGDAGTPDTAALAGAGPAIAIAGTPGPAGTERMARVIGRGTMPVPRDGGGASRPERQLGRGFAAEARVEMPQVAAAPAGGNAAGQPAAQSGAQRRQPMGSAGNLASMPAAGALSAVGPVGPTLPTAAAHRTLASQEGPAAPGVSPNTAATLARSSRGLDLPAVAMPLEEPVPVGAGGPSETMGAMASRLEPGSAGGQQATDTGRSVGAIPAQALAGAGKLPSGGLSEGVIAAAWFDRPDRGSALPGEPSVGSGRLARAAGPPALSAPEAEMSGQETGTAPAGTLAATGTGGAAEAVPAEPHRRSTGMGSGLPAAVAGAPVSDLAVATVGAGGLRRAAPGLASSGPEMAEVGGGPIQRRQPAGGLPGLPGPTEEVPAASLAASGAAGAGKNTTSREPAADGEASRRPGGLPVQIAALAGPGGLSYDPSALLGVPSRHARPESEVVHPIASRFVVERSAGDLSMQGRLREMSKEAFRERDPDTRGQTARTRGGSESTERAVEMGLDFLARHQFPDGHWSLDRTPADNAGEKEWGAGQMNADTAGTGLSLLAFLGAGYTHREEKYRTVVRNGIDWLIANQQADGRLFTERTDQTLYGRMYGHGIATIALCEAYGMTKDPELRGPAQRAVQFILGAQHPTQGGWRYEPRLESDTSVSGWQLMALRSAQMAGIEVASENLQRVSRWLDLSQALGGSRYRYNPYAANTPEQRQGRVPNRTMTAEGLLMRMYLGWERENPALLEGAEFLKSNLPEVGTPARPLRDSYYWYYATQVMFHMQGDYWTAWNSRLHPLLESSQLTNGPLAGSWDPQAPVADRWSHAAGRLYVTTLNLLMLEVYYRHLPLYQTLAQ